MSLAVLWRTCTSQMTVQRDEATSPLDRAGLFSRATFWWVMPTLKIAHAKGKLDIEDLPELARADDPGSLFRKFDALSREARLDGGSWWPLITHALFHTQRAVFLQSFLLGWLFLALMFLDPIILRALLNAVTPATADAPDASPPATLSYKFALVVALSLSMLLRVTCMEVCYFTSVRTCNNARSTLVMAIFASALDSNASAQDTGRLTNLMATGF